MKLFVVSCLIVGAVAELPRYRPARFRFQRQELAPITTDPPTEETTEETGPYPSSGWKPAGQAFTLPTETTPAPTYGPPEANGPYPPSGWQPEGQAFTLPQTPPDTSYGIPDNTYGAPDNTYGTPSTDATTTDKPAAQELEGPVGVQKSIGAYYVLLPNGQLQRVEFVTENDIQNMKYTARLQLRDRVPLYVFGP